MSPPNHAEHGWLIKWDARRLDTLLLAERLDFGLGELLHVHGNLGPVEHDDAAFATRSTPYDGHQALLAGKDGVVRQRKPESTTSR